MQKQKTLILISVVALILFASAVLWKNSKESNAEVVNYDSVKELTKTKQNQQAEDQAVTMDRKEKQKSKVDYKKEREKISKKMNISLFYPTAEKLYEGIKEAQEKGNDKRADELIEFLLEEYPDFEMPDE